MFCNCTFQRIQNWENEECAICKTCWNKLESFEEFFCAVKINYNIVDDEGETFVTEALDDTLGYVEILEPSLNTEHFEPDRLSDELPDAEESIENQEDFKKTKVNYLGELKKSQCKIHWATLGEKLSLKFLRIVRNKSSLSQKEFDALREFVTQSGKSVHLS